jgi:hypothetical protein
LRIATKIQSGTLRSDSPERTWGGMGNGRPCDACGRAIGATDLELEADFDDARTTLRFHSRCFSAWQHAAQQQRGLTAI